MKWVSRQSNINFNVWTVTFKIVNICFYDIFSVLKIKKTSKNIYQNMFYLGIREIYYAFCDFFTFVFMFVRFFQVILDIPGTDRSFKFLLQYLFVQ